MTTPSKITQWLMQPANFSDNDRKEAAALLKAFPYFVPARYIEAAEHHKKQPFAPAMMNTMQLHMGNWLLFYEFMQSAKIASAPNYGAASIEDEFEDEIIADAATQEFIDENEEDDFAVEEDDEDIDFGSFNEGEEKIIAEDEILMEGDEEDYDIEVEPVEKTVIKKEEPQPQQKTKSKPEEEIINDSQPAPATEPVNQILIQEEKAEPQIAKKETPQKPKEQIPFFKNRKEDSLIQPIYTEDYFLHQGIPVSDKIPSEADHQQEAKSLMVVMSFSEWLIHFKTKGEREKEEQQDQKALKTMWQKEKLAAALEEENEEIPENVFEMAVNSITKEDDLASESLAEILMKQGKYDRAIDMYRKLSLRNPQKSTYFARKIDDIQKEKS